MTKMLAALVRWTYGYTERPTSVRNSDVYIFYNVCQKMNYENVGLIKLVKTILLLYCQKNEIIMCDILSFFSPRGAQLTLLGAHDAHDQMAN